MNTEWSASYVQIFGVCPLYIQLSRLSRLSHLTLTWKFWQPDTSSYCFDELISEPTDRMREQGITLAQPPTGNANPNQAET